MMEIIPEEWRRLSHKERRSYVNKQRRRYRRIHQAQQRETEEEALKLLPDYLEAVCLEERRSTEELRREEAKSMLENAAWLQRERLAQVEFGRKKRLEEERRKEREDRERLIREEWDALKRKEKEENETKEKEKMEKEERLKVALSVGDGPRALDKEPWHNPIAPEGYEATPQGHTHSRDYATEKDKQNCSFFLKTGACRFGDRCSRLHPRPTSGRTLMVPSMYSSLGLKEQMLNERDQDVALEHDEQEIYEHFSNFYNDVLPEFSKAGKVVQFKVSCNYEIHLRGNVYVQYSAEEECMKAFQMFNGRWYAQKQLSVQFCPVSKWKNAICGLFNQKRCPKGRSCNFLHVFSDPHGAFFRADRDLPPFSPRRSASGHHSPARKHHFGEWDRRGSRSTRSSRSRSGSRDRSHRRSWRGERSRSKSRERSRYSHQRLRSCSRSESRERSRYKHQRNYRRKSSSHSRSKSRERSGRGRQRGARSESRSKSRERSGRGRQRGESRSPGSRSLSRSRSRSSTSSDEKHNRRHRRHKRKKKKKRGKKGKNHNQSPSSDRDRRGKHRHRRTDSPLSHAHQDSPDDNDKYEGAAKSQQLQGEQREMHTVAKDRTSDERRERPSKNLTLVSGKPSEVQDRHGDRPSDKSTCAPSKPSEVQDRLPQMADKAAVVKDRPPETQDKLTEVQEKPEELAGRRSGSQDMEDEPTATQNKP